MSILLGCILVLAGWIPRAEAQTVISPTPLVPMQEPGSALDIPSARAVMTEDAGVDDSDEKRFHIPLIFNESVEGQIEYFTTRGRAIFQAWLDRSARYLPLMKKIFRDHNLPEDLVYVAMIESGFNPRAVSPQKATGPWQFMKATGKEYGLVTDRWVDERRDPIKSTIAAAAHFKDLYNLFGSWPLALASYNAGMGRMQGAILKARSDDFWDLRSSRLLGAETQEYVPRYMAALIIAKNPVAYGFNRPEENPFEFDEIEIKGSTDLRRIAAYTGSTCEEIQELNPELLQPRTPGAIYVLRIPPGTREAYEARLASKPGRERPRQEARSAVRLNGAMFSRIASGPIVPASRTPGGTIVSLYRAQLEPLSAMTGPTSALPAFGMP